MSFSAHHLGFVLFAGALALSETGCQSVRMLSRGFAECAPAGAQPELVNRDRSADYQFDRPPAAPAAIPDGVAASPLRADSPANASHPEEVDPTAPVATPDVVVLASRLEARGARITRDGFDSVLTIDLSNTDVIDEDLEHLRLFDQLQELNLSGTRISNESLDDIARAPRLEFLGLTGTRIDNAGLRKIARLTQLRFLSLAGTDVTDSGLDSLGQLRNLEAINLRATRVTPAGVSALQSRLPGCRIVVDTGDGETSGLFEDLRPSAPRMPHRNEPTRLYPTPRQSTAQRQLENIIRNKLCEPDVLHALAALRAAEGNWDEARASMRYALEQRPDDRGLRFDYAVTLAHCQDLEGSFGQFERAVGRAAAHYNLGVLLVEKGWFAAARRHFQGAVAADPTMASAHDWLAYIDGDSLHPGDAGDPGLLSPAEFRSLFGSLLNEGGSPPLGESPRPLNPEIQSAGALQRTSESIFEPARPFETFNASFAPITGNSGRDW